MRRYWKEILLSAGQLALFYLLPLSAGPTDMMGLVFAIIIGTFVLSLLMGVCSANSGKWVYPLLTATIFLPSIPIYYNETATIHALWYLVISGIGLLLGACIRWIIKRK